jgi:hypothetical protein
MKTEEDEAFDELARKQGDWGGGYQAKRRMAADKFIAAEERKVGERYGYVPRLHPSEYMGESAQEPVLDIDGHVVGKMRKSKPTQEPVARVTGVYGGRFTYDPINPAMVLPVGMALYSAPKGNT